MKLGIMVVEDTWVRTCTRSHAKKSLILSFSSPILPSDHVIVVPITRPPRVQVAFKTDCIVTREDWANTTATLTNVRVTLGAGDERGWVFPNILPGPELSKKACSGEPLVRGLVSVHENPRGFRISTARSSTKLAGR